MRTARLRRIEARRKAGRNVLRPAVEELEQRIALSSAYLFDFGPPTSPVPSGTVGVSLQTYTPALGYGWVSTVGLDTRDRGTSDPLTRAFVFGANGTFLVNLPNGAYDVTPVLGDASYNMGPVGIWAEGQQVAAGLTAPGGQFLRPTYTVNVTGGQLVMRFAGTAPADPTSLFRLDALQITPATATSNPVVALAGGPYSGFNGSAVTLSASATGGTGVYTYAWDLNGSGQYATAGQQVTYTPPGNGTWTVSLKATDSAGRSSVSSGSITVSNTFDFGTPTSPVSPGTLGVSLQTYTPALGYGWVSTAGLEYRDRGTSDPLTRAFVFGANGTFLVNLPNGAYDVTPVLGDASYNMGPVGIWAEGQQVAAGLTAPGGQFLRPTYTVNVTGGQLVMRFAGTAPADPTSLFRLDALQITPATAASKPVVASARGPYSGPDGSTITLSASATGGTGVYTYAWDLNGSGQYATAGQQVTYTPPDNGTRTVSLKVTDSSGLSAFSSTSVTTTNVAPTAAAGGPYATMAGLGVTFNGSATDPSPTDTAAGFVFTWNFGDGSPVIAGLNLVSPVHIYSAPGSYTVTVTAADKEGAVSTAAAASVQISLPNAQAVTSPQILLTPTVLASLRTAAANQTPQWLLFKARLDGQLNQVISGGYQASDMAWIADYALGYQVLMNSDPVTAAAYADKAIAVMKSALNDYQIDNSTTRQFLVRGDGTTTTFTLPNADLLPSSLTVYLGAVTTTAVIHGATNGADDTGIYYAQFLKVSNTPDGAPTYAQGVDWQYNPNLLNNYTSLIDWSLASSNQPAPGSTYYVTSADRDGATATAAYTLKGNQITFKTAPGANQAVFVQYVYGTHAADGSSLAYQQTSAGNGGFNSILIDSGYTARYLGKSVAIGLDWLWAYPGLNQTLKNQAMDLLTRWSDYCTNYGYEVNDVASNYGEGMYVSNVMTALALSGGRSSAGPRLLAEVVNFRLTNVVPMLTNPTSSLAGGFWAEGWNYGALAVQNLLLAGLALETAGQGPATVERQWASQVVTSLIQEQPSQSTIYPGGDWYQYPAPFPSKDLIDILSSMASDPAARSSANYILDTYPGAFSGDFVDLLFRDPTAPAAFWSTQPLQYQATGTGLVTARADWNYNSTWVSLQMGNMLPTNHQTNAPGDLLIQRGGDALLVDATTVASYINEHKAPYANTVIIDDNGDGNQVYRYDMGAWYGTPGVVTTAYEATASDVYVAGDYKAAYSLNTDPGGGGSATQLTRQMVYLRPNLIVVHDRVGTLKPTYAKQLRWNFQNAPTVNGNSFVETAGSSKLFGMTFSSSALTTAEQPYTLDGANLYQIITQNANPALNVTYTTAFETAPSSAGAMVATTQVQSTDGRMEGVQMANQVVLFGTSGAVDMSSGPIAYTVNGTAPVSNLLTDLTPGQSYLVLVNGAAVGTFAASSQGTLTFTTTTPTGSQTQSIVVSLPPAASASSIVAAASLGATSSAITAGAMAALVAQAPTPSTGTALSTNSTNSPSGDGQALQRAEATSATHTSRPVNQPVQSTTGDLITFASRSDAAPKASADGSLLVSTRLLIDLTSG